MARFDPTAVYIMLIIIVPVIAGFRLIAHRLKLQQDQFKMMMEERKLLIEKGATELPPVTLPTSNFQRFNAFRHLRVGVVFTLLAAALGAYAAMHDGKINMFGSDFPDVIIWIIGAVGVAHLALFFLRRAYERPCDTQDPRAQ